MVHFLLVQDPVQDPVYNVTLTSGTESNPTGTEYSTLVHVIVINFPSLQDLVQWHIFIKSEYRALTNFHCGVGYLIM